MNNTLGQVGPEGVADVEWYFQQSRDHRGKKLVDALWQCHTLKVYSERLVALLEDQGATLRTWPADVRLKDGTPVEGYRFVLEEDDRPGVVHSMWRGRRSWSVVVHESVRQAAIDAKMTGLEFEEVATAFPGDNGYYDDEDD